MIHRVVLALLVAGCAARSTVREHIPTPYPQGFEISLAVGDQRELRETVCSKTFVGQELWSAALEREGYSVELSGWVMGHPGWRETYALRFRRPPLFGDVTARPAKEEGCIEYVIRLQRAKDALHPAAWTSKHPLAPLFRLLRSDNASTAKLFDASRDHLYPAGYP